MLVNTKHLKDFAIRATDASSEPWMIVTSTTTRGDPLPGGEYRQLAEWPERVPQSRLPASRCWMNRGANETWSSRDVAASVAFQARMSIQDNQVNEMQLAN
jgi:hypothetical protein